MKILMPSQLDLEDFSFQTLYCRVPLFSWFWQGRRQGRWVRTRYQIRSCKHVCTSHTMKGAALWPLYCLLGAFQQPTGWSSPACRRTYRPAFPVLSLMPVCPAQNGNMVLAAGGPHLLVPVRPNGGRQRACTRAELTTAKGGKA